MPVQKMVRPVENDSAAQWWIYYIDPQRRTLRTLKIDVPRAQLTVVVDPTESQLTVISLNVVAAHRGQGLARRLLLELARESLEQGIVRIDLDDMSARFQQEANIYKCLGFRYSGDGPEMTASPHDIINTSKNIG